ncbi:Alpha/Beta hydrolase protein [Lasiosphaeria miniovina]|uniref:Alpha/Beta hydrolase protein n=1 Tax=Lasiosphaeria miniovina TaxID=1954250 RepID=A0AA40BIQ4_9PEZI|nr:Alpha/Beta hydrolase protein [Lasiosphaeria miniovina]KAK0734956.1 Alpha/Beta hydrolase protein [Lasiosphaeria miniovina]
MVANGLIKPSSTALPEANGFIEDFAQQAEKLSHQRPVNGDGHLAVEARFVTPQDPVLIQDDGSRLPPVPLEEAYKLNVLRREVIERAGSVAKAIEGSRETRAGGDKTSEPHGEKTTAQTIGQRSHRSTSGSLRRSQPPSHTNPLFPPLPLYGPPSLGRDIQCFIFRVSSFFLSLGFLGVIVLGSLFTSLPPFFRWVWLKATYRDPDLSRPFYEEEQRRKELRIQAERQWKQRRRSASHSQSDDGEVNDTGNDGFVPTEGGPDPIVCDAGYYARRVGLDVETFEVQTEDGFIIDLWHVYDPREHTPLPQEERAHCGPEVFGKPRKGFPPQADQKPKFPVLMMHGLLQSSGAYCVNDEDSLAFFLCKSGYDVWLGNNRCGFKPKHVLLDYSDPRMWCWNIRQMGVFDLPALTSRVLYETGFEKIGLICHSQGTTQTFVALAKEQRPDLGEKLTVFCALAPAAYAGPLIGKMYFKFMRVITPAMFRLMFGIGPFIPFMMAMHRLLSPRMYGWMGYKVFSFLFNWTDKRWDCGLRDRMFQFAPVYVSAESMRWWLGRECFAKHKCILSTKEEWRAEDREDSAHDDSVLAAAASSHGRRAKGAKAWYNHQVCPFALWICGNDCLVDGEKLLRRFQRGREPHVRLVHSKVIDEYEHLDVIWAMDAVDKVFREVREVLWKTCNVREQCRTPRGCGDVAEWTPPPSPGEDGDGNRDGGGDEDGDGGVQSNGSGSSSSGEELSPE